MGAKQGQNSVAELIQSSPIASGSSQVTSAISSAFVTNGGAGTDLGAPNGYTNNQTPPGGAVEDILIYVPPSVEATVSISGGADNVFGGTMYMPSCDVTMNGTSDESSITTMFVSVIGNAVKITGDSYLNFTYDPNRDYGMSSYLQVQK